MSSHVHVLLQLMSQGPGGTRNDEINLNVHAIDELKTKGIPTTDDSPKYAYDVDGNGHYSEKLKLINFV